MNANIMVVDIESYDPELSSLGSGVYRKDCYILGVAVVTDSGFRNYFNLRHPGCSAETRTRNRAELATLLESSVPKLGHNFLYDLDMLINLEGLKVNGRYEDTQIRESLLDAYANHYDLDTLSKKYGGEGKRDTGIEEICNSQGWTGAPQTHLYKMPGELVAEYALGDAEETLFVWQQQQAKLEEEELLHLYGIECDLFRPLLAMRKQGIRIDRNKRSKVSMQLRQAYSKQMLDFSKDYGVVNINSPTDLKKVFNTAGLAIPQTEKGNASFSHDNLISIDHPVVKQILSIRGLKTVINNFVDGALVDFDTNGRIHATFYPVVRDDGGTVTGRFSCKNPNLQQIPSKEEKFGPLIREIFIPEEGCDYLKVDYSQIEYRVLAHYAVGPGAKDVKQRFCNDPTTDYHQYVCELTGLGRKYAKNLNFGTVYCMGPPTMSKKFGWTLDHAKEVSSQYFQAMPFVKPTRDLIMERAKCRGYVRTVLGRRARLADSMRSKYGQRGQEYKLVNYLIQGSAADIMKAAMVKSYKAGIFDAAPCHITVHDELGLSVPKDRVLTREIVMELKECMETAVKLTVPIIADPEIGPSWGNVEAYEL